MQTKKLDEAIAAHKKALELDPKLGNAHNYLGVVYLLKGMSVEAEAEFNEFKKYEAEKKCIHLMARHLHISSIKGKVLLAMKLVS